MRYIVLSFLYLYFSASLVFGQDSFSSTNFGPEVNTAYHELYPILSPDGKSLFFVRANHPNNNYDSTNSQDIWVSTKIDDTIWTIAARARYPLNTARYNAVMAISGDGTNMYINGIFDKKMQWKKRGISVVPIIGSNDYGTPKTLKVKGLSRINKGKFSQISLNPAEDIMILSFSKKWNSKNNELFLSSKKNNGKWKKPKKLKKPINVNKINLSPQLSTDSSGKLYFTSKEKNANSFSIWESKSLDSTYKKWSSPVKLNYEINSSKFDGFFSLNKKASRAYFASDRDTVYGGNDIYTIKLFEENPYMLLKGTIVNQYTKRPFNSSDSIQIAINGKITDTISIDPIHGQFTTLLPLGESYTLKPLLQHYNGQEMVIDLSTQREFIAKTDTLYLAPWPYAKITGKLKVKNTDKPVEKFSNPEILVNGAKPDSIQIDSSGNYSLFLNHGKTYILTSKADNFVQNDDKLDLRSLREYKEVPMDLYLNLKPKPKPKVAIMTGKIINTKTMKGIDSTVTAQILINDFPSLDVSIQDSTYTVNLPLGNEYSINASADFFYPTLETVDLKNEKENVKIFKDLYIAPLEVGASVKLEQIFFETGKAALKAESFSELDRVVQLMYDFPSIKIEIAGHTDNVGSESLNKKLSQDRATSVETYLKSKGIPTERVSAVGYGMEKPIADNETTEGKQQNRRVEFTILER
jgi:outer membrane protein OmpA-like peptidoglycan-associated protein